MWDLVPWPRIKPKSPALGVRSLSHWTTRKVPSAHDSWISQPTPLDWSRLLYCQLLLSPFRWVDFPRTFHLLWAASPIFLLPPFYPIMRKPSSSPPCSWSPWNTNGPTRGLPSSELIDLFTLPFSVALDTSRNNLYSGLFPCIMMETCCPLVLYNLWLFQDLSADCSLPSISICRLTNSLDTLKILTAVS